MPLKSQIIAILVAQACYVSAMANTSTRTTALEPIIVSDISNTNATISQQDLNRMSAKDLRGVLSTIPNVNVKNLRHGQLGDIEIRGIGVPFGMATGHNQVTVELDGIPMTQSFQFPHIGNHGRQYFDTADLKRVTVHKGPSQDGLAGHIRLQTKDARDYLKENQRYGGQLRMGYIGDSDAYHIGLSGSTLLGEKASASISYTRRWFNEFNNKGGLDVVGNKRSKSNPSSGYSNSLNVKFDFTPNNVHEFKLNLQHYDLTSRLNEVSSLGQNTRYITHTKTNQQKNQRNAFALSHELHHENALFDTLSWQVSLQNTKSQMAQQTDRTVPTTQKREILREGDDFKTTMLNFKMDLNKSAGEHIVNDFNYGLKLQQSKVQALRSRQEKTLAFFPTQKQMQAKLYLSDRMSFGTSGISLTPSVYLTHIKIKPQKENLTEKKSQELFNYSRTALGYGLRADYLVNQAQLLSLNYHHAIRLPGYGENNVQSYGHWSARPNPNLKPETSDGLELTWRSEGEWGKQTTTLFYNRYRDLIFLDMSECGRPSNFNQNVPCDLANQKGKSRVYGIEFDGKFNLDMIGLIKGMTLSTGFSYGKDKDNLGKPRGYINPLTGFVALDYTQPDDIWGVQAKVKFAAAKKVKDMPKTSGWERLPGYAVLDITAHYNVTQNLNLDVGVYNALDKQYAVWGRARGAIYNGDYRSHTEAGRHFGANISYKF